MITFCYNSIVFITILLRGMFTMHKLCSLKRIKFNILICLVMGIFTGGVGFCSYAAEVVADVSAEAIPVSQNVSCTVDSDGTVTYMAQLNSAVTYTDDGMLYLLEMAPFEYEVTGDTDIIASKPYDVSETIPAFNFPVNFRQEDTRLYSKFTIAVKRGGTMCMLTEPTYITNPEALAWNTLMRYPRTKKSTQGDDFNNLFLDGTYGPELGWIYKTIQVLNTGTYQPLTNPMSRTEARNTDSHKISNPNYYMFNASDEEGVKAIVQSMEYYVANSKGGENWIIGNEVNVRAWNYMTWTDWDTYVREYTQVFRVMYNAIMSTNANARVYVCIDHVWDKNLTPADKEYYEYMDGKDFLEKFNTLIKQSGDINWGLAQHPYTNPLNYSKFWDMSGCKNGAMYDAQVRTGQVVTFQNLSLLTDFMQTEAMLDTEGNVRHIILSEIGLTNAQGGEIQAAAICASYAAVVDNPYIDEMIYLLEYSEPSVDTRLDEFSGKVYDEIDGENSEIYMDWAKSYIGINDWSDILW